MSQTPAFIAPLFLSIHDPTALDQALVSLTHDDYNKAEGHSLLGAQTDAEAISAFLSEFRDSPLTLQSYAKEIERLLLWCLHVAEKNVASLRRDDLVAYQAFLKKPTPKKQWVGPRVGKQHKDGTLNPNWRPFAKPLGTTSINKAITILDAFFNYLVQANYLTGNPFAVERRRKRRPSQNNHLIDRYLEIEEIITVIAAIDHYPAQTEQQIFQVARAKYIILLLFYTGLRISEAADHCMGDFLQRQDNWFLRVTGKGKKIREIPIPDDLLKALAHFRSQIGLTTTEPTFREPTPLIPMKNLKQGISTRRIDQIVKWAFNLAAHVYEQQHNPRRASKLQQASAHWLRHSYVTALLDAGAPLKVAQENAGHSDVGTTMHYRHITQTDRHLETRGLSLKNLQQTTIYNKKE